MSTSPGLLPSRKRPRPEEADTVKRELANQNTPRSAPVSDVDHTAKVRLQGFSTSFGSRNVSYGPLTTGFRGVWSLCFLRASRSDLEQSRKRKSVFDKDSVPKASTENVCSTALASPSIPEPEVNESSQSSYPSGEFVFFYLKIRNDGGLPL